ncbi:MAG TPA: sigma-70 family RNA polymerase sigma factor [Puia sp.]|nr:sigma-70 family RNA polymerase sigma factor [Puia sp.]
MRHLSTPKIVGGFNRREPASITWIYNQYHSSVIALVIQQIGQSSDVEDLAGDVFVKLLNTTGRFEQLKQIKYFLISAARTTCVDYLRHMEVVKSRFVELDEDYPDNDSWETAETRDVNTSLIYRAIEMLTGQLKQIYHLYYVDDLRNDEIAERLGISKRTVANSKNLALNRLKDILRNIGYSIIIILDFLL